MKCSTFAVPPSIRGGEQEIAVVENSQAQLGCVAEGVPQPSLSWEKDGNPLIESTGEYTILPSGELVIDMAQVRETKTRTGKQQIIFVFVSVVKLVCIKFILASHCCM